jgi:hypothetical protein
MTSPARSFALRFFFCAFLCGVAPIAASGCGGASSATKGGTDDGAEAAEATALSSSATVTVAEGTGEVGFTCTAGTPELCNAVDDNCDGQIDEGCGWDGGALQITLAWNTRADVDLFVRDPRGELLSHQSPKTASGGEMNHSARGGCVTGTAAEAKADQIENAVWKAPPAPGDYELVAHYWGECTGGGATMVTVTISAFGRVIGSYNAELDPGDKRSVATIHVAE